MVSMLFFTFRNGLDEFVAESRVLKLSNLQTFLKDIKAVWEYVEFYVDVEDFKGIFGGNERPEWKAI